MKSILLGVPYENSFSISFCPKFIVPCKKYESFEKISLETLRLLSMNGKHSHWQIEMETNILHKF